MENITKNNSLSENPTPPSTTPVLQKRNEFKELLKFALIALPLVLFVRAYVIGPFIVSGPSMDTTFSSGQYLIVDEISHRFQSPERGDIIIFKYPLDTTRFFIKRIIGLPGETVEIKNGIVTIINTQYPAGQILIEPYIDEVNKKIDSSHIVLNNEQYFVMGDNRASSSDSRIWGPITENLIIGRPVLRLLPIQKISVFPGRQEEYN